MNVDKAQKSSVQEQLQKLILKYKSNPELCHDLNCVLESAQEEAKSNNNISEKNAPNQELRRLKHQYSALLDNLPEMDVYLFDKENRFLIAGGQEKQKFGYTKSDFLGKKVNDITEETIVEKFSPIISKTLAGERIETEIKTKGRVYKIITQPIYDDSGKTEYGIMIGHNITKLKKAQDKLRKAKIEAERIAQVKSNFLANMSHEIRTPLNAIMGFSEQLAKTDLTEEQRKFNHLVNESSEHLFSLVNEILILLKIGMGKVFIDNTPFNVRKVFNDVFQFFKIKAERKGIELLYQVDDEVAQVLIGDPFRLKQIMINLISNAIKFTNFGSVRFSCSVKKDHGDFIKLKIDVKDTGIGINTNDLSSIFDEFSQAENMVKEKHGGTGLGLTISKKLIELQKGSIKVKSQINKGSHFTVIIPYKKGSEQDILKEDQSFTINNELLAGKRILLADDDSYNRELAHTILKNWGTKFDIVKNGEEAYNKAIQHQYDLILMDIHMPILNGMQATKRIKTQNESLNKHTKIVALTANITKSDIVEYMKSGMDDYIIKPIKEDEFYNKLCNVLDIPMNGNFIELNKEVLALEEEEIKKAYDLSDLKSATRGNKIAFNKMLQTFLDNSVNGIEELQAELDKENWDTIRETAHRLVSSIRYFKIEVVPDKLRKIEESVIHKDYEEIPEMIHEAVSILDDILFQMKNEIITE
ncbi:response regulator [Plebeiibacterium sediminum]|uniref:histidine kinase n=1 Tax=Plebeiibacterium sediminum TaxID=2992112 RepID=A0AAE3M138_9BACT|nr:response regulator [Plebeiobacterium sediminum]MCW3784887.1 response regulator [Plebeiobacterium sediminum]